MSEAPMPTGNPSEPIRNRASLRAGDDLGIVVQSAFTRTPARQAITFSVAILVLLAVGTLMIWQAQQYMRGNTWVERTMQVLVATETVHAQMRALESDARAYRLTDRVDMLEEYASDKAQMERGLQELTQLLHEVGTPSNLDRIQALIRQRVEHLDTLNQLQKDSGAEAARQSNLSQNASGSLIMRELQAELAQLSSDQRNQLDTHKQEVAWRTRLLMGLIAIGMLVPIGMLLMVRGTLMGEARYRTRMERQASSRSQELKESLASLNRLYEDRQALNTYTGMLQSCQNLDEALTSTRAVIAQLLPGASGLLMRMRASQNLLESVGELGQAQAHGTHLFAPDTCWGLRRGNPHHLTANSPLPRCPHLAEDTPAPQDDDGETLCIPLSAQGTTLGLMQVQYRPEPGDDTWRMYAESIAEQLSLSIANLDLRETLRHQSLRDPLTGLFNRRYLEENLNRELLRCARRQLPISAIMLDVDHFKRFNDQHGHAAGDALLAAVGQVLQQHVRGEDIACRYGGEEFILILPETAHETALQRADEIRQAIAATTISHMHQTYGPATASLGVSTAPELAYDAAVLQQAADAALYAAKHGGRNRVASAMKRQAQETNA